MDLGQYILNDAGVPVREPDFMKFAVWFYDSSNYIVARQELAPGVEVSTVFLGFDHNHGRKGPPILWETMCFGGPLDDVVNRCPGTREQAEAMHRDMVDAVEALLAVEANKTKS